MDFNRKQRFSIRKFTFGAASVLLGVTFASTTASADEAVSGTVGTAGAGVVKVSDHLENTTTQDQPSSLEEVKETTVANTSSEEVKEKATAEVAKETEVVASTPTVDVPDAKVEASKEVKEEAKSVVEQAEDISNKEEKVASSSETSKEEGYTSFRSASSVANRAAEVGAANVANWGELVSAFSNRNISKINLSSNIVAPTTTSNPASVDHSQTIAAAGRTVTVSGSGRNIDFGSTALKFTGSSPWNITLDNVGLMTGNSKGALDLSATRGKNTVTFKDVKSKGSSLYGGGGNTDVVIKGNTTTTVSDTYRRSNGQTQAVQRNVGSAGSNVNRREANIHSAKSVTVAKDAVLTVKRSSMGDGINLASGSTIKVEQNATLDIAMNTSNSTESPRYHNAAIFMDNGGNLITGRRSKVTINSSIGQAISFGVKRPADGITDRDRFGGYGVGSTSKKQGSSTISIGEDGVFNFTGRDGVIAGHNTRFTTGEKAKVHFENKGRGVALDLGDNSHIVFGKNSNNTFHSTGKNGTSGSYDGYNYIGVNERGTITVDNDAAFRVYMDNRGANPWDDVISLDTRSGRMDQPLFKVNEGAIVDVRDDNTDYYGELISTPLGNATNVVFQFNNPLYVSFLRYTNSRGLSSGNITGKLPQGIAQGANPESIAHGNILFIANGTAASGNKIEFNGPGRRGGTYTVYSLNQDGRDTQNSDKKSSVWTGIHSGSLSIAGFKKLGNQTEITPSNAQSHRTLSSSGGVSASDNKYGIDPVQQNRQNVWISNGTIITPQANHKNTIRYVYEDGTPVLDEDGKALVVVQESDWTRRIETGIDKTQFGQVLNRSRVGNADQFLTAYGKARYVVSDITGDRKADTGWVVRHTKNTVKTYDTVNSPVLNNYEAFIQSTNIPGLTAGSEAQAVTATLNGKEIKDTVTQKVGNATVVTDTYWNNFNNTGFPKDFETVVVYKKLVPQNAVIRYMDVTANTQLSQDATTGLPGETIAYSTTAKIADYVKRGYELVRDGFAQASTADKVYDRDEATTQTFVVELRQKIVDITDPAKIRKDVTRTIEYLYEGTTTKAAADATDKVSFTRTGKRNLVTNVETFTAWTAVNNDTTFNAVKSPVIAGYKPNHRAMRAITGVTADTKDVKEQVFYSRLDQKAIIRYVNVDRNNSDIIPRVTVAGKAGDVIDYSTESTIQDLVSKGYEFISDNFTADTARRYSMKEGATPVFYVKFREKIVDITEPAKITKDVNQTIHYVYEDGSQAKPDAKDKVSFTRTGKRNLVTKEETFTPWVAKNNDTTFDAVTSPTIAGYKASQDEVPATTGITVTTPDKEITVKYVTTDQVALIRYINMDRNNVDIVTPDRVTGKSGSVINYSTSPRIKELEAAGYELVSDSFAHGGTAKHFDYNDKATQVYIVRFREKYEDITDPAKIAKDVTQTIHYVYEDGSKAKPDAKDKVSFTRTGRRNLVTKEETFTPWVAKDNDTTFDAVTSPAIAGFTPDKATVAAKTGLTETSKDIVETVTYLKDGQKAIIKYVNENGNKEITRDAVTGKSGDPIVYSTDAKIKELVNKGYELVNDGFTKAANKVYDNDKNKDQEYTVVLREKVSTVPPTDPKTPGTPIEPNNPEGPKWPEGVSENDLNKVVTQTIHYVYEDKKKAAEDVVDRVKFTRIATVNHVTGAVTYTTWTAENKDTTFDAVTSPTIAGFTPDKAVVDAVTGLTETSENIEKTVTYVPDTQQAVVRYINQATNEVITSKPLTGQSGKAMTYSTSAQILTLNSQGYVLVSDGYTSGGPKFFDYDTKVTQVFDVILKSNSQVTPGDDDGRVDV